MLHWTLEAQPQVCSKSVTLFHFLCFNRKSTLQLPLHHLKQASPRIHLLPLLVPLKNRYFNNQSKKKLNFFFLRKCVNLDFYRQTIRQPQATDAPSPMLPLEGNRPDSVVSQRQIWHQDILCLLKTLGKYAKAVNSASLSLIFTVFVWAMDKNLLWGGESNQKVYTKW